MKAGVGDTISNYTALYDWKLGCEETAIVLTILPICFLKRRFTSLLYSEAKSLTTVPDSNAGPVTGLERAGDADSW